MRWWVPGLRRPPAVQDYANDPLPPWHEALGFNVNLNAVHAFPYRTIPTPKRFAHPMLHHQST